MESKLPSNWNYQKIKAEDAAQRLSEAFKNFRISARDVANAFAHIAKNLPKV